MVFLEGDYVFDKVMGIKGCILEEYFGFYEFHQRYELSVEELNKNGYNFKMREVYYDKFFMLTCEGSTALHVACNSRLQLIHRPDLEKMAN